ncbi:retinol dehydrogenase 12 [Folsomia candida]|uniref:retinol dehydrogenase 12 n=1 Tax=Folsomia candida TaxID=158441 RepID=UPI000B901752|nr:retinol dehydrogenase 12 [Folsomia candida]
MGTQSGSRVLPAPGSGGAKLVKFLTSSVRLGLTAVWQPRALYREFYKKPEPLRELPNRAGEVVVLTGGTRGIGLQVLTKLLQSGFHVIMGCRSLLAGGEVIASIRAVGITTGSCQVLELDLKSLKSVYTFAATVLQEVDRIDLLINNAGVMFSPYEITENGYESQFQVNYLSHFVLTSLLLPRVKETSLRVDKHVACRIVNVSSVANYGGKIDFDELEECKVYVSTKAYADSKLCQILHTRYLDTILRSEKHIKVNVLAVHPGTIVSELWDNLPRFILVIANAVKGILQTTEDGANTIIYTALSPKLEGIGGVYIANCEIVPPNQQVENVHVQQQLWERSLELGKL